VRAYFRRLLTANGYDVELAGDGATATELLERTPPHVVLLDVYLPDVNGIDLCRQLRQSASTRLLPVILVTGSDAIEHRVAGLEVGADDFLTKPVDTHELIARVRSLVRLKRFTDDLDSASSIIMALATMIEARDGYGDGHCSRMANYAMSLGKHIGLPDEELQHLYRGGFLHDIGMLAISDTILRKPGTLEDHEYALVKSHTVIGDKLCGQLRSLQPVRPIIRSHHERLDGSGYPDGLHGTQIPVAAQIVAIADAYEAITSGRPYQPAQTPDFAIEVLRRQVEGGWRSHELVEAFAEVIRSHRPM